MIHITNKWDCCGCEACVQKCPKHCITLYADTEGFLYPVVNKDNCIDCRWCEMVCPVINPSIPQKPLKVYAAKNPNEEIRIKSSSGGIFTMLAERTINQNGVVFGACFNDKWEIVHSYTEDIKGIECFRGSKYAQSIIGETYKQVELFLKQNREVLFSGTPCQIAGLHRFLRKEYRNLITVDVVCHGVPSPRMWKDYLNNITNQKKTVNISDISNISFRDKLTGWKNYSFAIQKKSSTTSNISDYHSKKEKENFILQETHDENIFMQGFLKNLYLRPSCHTCPSKSGRSGSDITIGDFWGIENYYPKFNDDKGCGLVIINTTKGQEIYRSLGAIKIETKYKEALKGNPSIEYSTKIPKMRLEFWKLYQLHGIDSISIVCEKMRPSRIRAILSRGKSLLNKIFNPK